MKAYSKDIFKTVWKEKKRFFSLMVIAALGVLVTTGLQAGCDDARNSADRYYKNQNLRDYYIQSTLGLTEDDVSALAALDGVDTVSGFFEETGYFSSDEMKYTVQMTTWSPTVDTPRLMEGILPESPGEIAVTEDFSRKFSVSVGDSIVLELTEDTSLTGNKLAICGIVRNVTNVNNPEGSTSFRDTSPTDFVVYISPDVVDSDIYTGIGITLTQSRFINTYSDEYTALISDFSEKLGEISAKRENARTDGIIADAMAEIADSEAEMNEEFRKAEQEFIDAEQELADAKTELDETKSMIDMGYIWDQAIIAQVESGLEDYENGVRELKEKRAEFEKEKADAIAEIEEAKEDVRSMERAEWYIFTRDSLSGYLNVSSDMGAIDSLSLMFDVVFLVVAVLVTLITVNRMIEENRSLIGTYKALGYSDMAIMRKYLIYALSAGLTGCLLGDALGYYAFPAVLVRIFSVMYTIPEYRLEIDPVMAIAAPMIFLGSILGAVVVTCLKAFRTMPAELMRPKAPKAGAKVLLERIPFLWSRFSFLNKVTARNVFRYKRRLLMTVLGIVGCTALLVTGFGLKDTVGHLMVDQYGEIIRYDLLSVVDEDEMEEYEKQLTGCGADYLTLCMMPVTLENTAGKTLQTQLYVFEDDADPGRFITLAEEETGETLKLTDDMLAITINAGVILNFGAGDTVTVRTGNLRQADFEVDALAMNYLGNMICMNRTSYERNFGEYRPNAVMAVTDSAKELADADCVRSGMITATLKEEFTTSFWLIDVIVYILIGLSGALAFVVLFTLSSTNISERERELATIKVLGFFDREVHLYINKEIFILTLIAVLTGLPTGKWICGMLTDALKMPSLYFRVYIAPLSYVLAFAITVAFSLLVNVMMHTTLDSIDPAEALKSIE